MSVPSLKDEPAKGRKAEEKKVEEVLLLPWSAPVVSQEGAAFLGPEMLKIWNALFKKNNTKLSIKVKIHLG